MAVVYSEEWVPVLLSSCKTRFSVPRACNSVSFGDQYWKTRFSQSAYHVQTIAMESIIWLHSTGAFLITPFVSISSLGIQSG